VRRHAAVAFAVAAALLTGATPLATSPRASAGTTPPNGGACPVFPADSVWNADISQLPVDPHSAAWLASMGAGSTNLHPDFGPSGDPSTPYGIPYTVVTDAHPKVTVSFQYADESDPGPYPFGTDTPIEGGPNGTGDRHAVMIDSTTCTLYELYDAQYSAPGSTAGSGAIWNLDSDALRPAGWTSADAAGLPIFPGLLRPDEVLAGAVTHAIRFTAANTDTSYIWPARHEAGSASDPSLPPMGARFRLKASFDISGYSPETQVVLRAMQHYGLILADNGSNWYFQGAASNSWDSQLIAELKTMPASAFEAVDESSLMVDPDSGATAQGALRVTTSPPVPAQVVVDGHITDSWGLNWVDLPVGTHAVSFTHVEGYTAPPSQTVTIAAGQPTTISAAYVARGELHVITSPAVPSQITVDGQPADNWGVWTDFPVGSHRVCFSPVAGFTPPPCQSVTLAPGATATVTGTFAVNPGAPAQAGTGLLRVATSPPVPSQITITPPTGQPFVADSWGINWLTLEPGTYVVGFGHVPGFTEPAAQTVLITAGRTSTVTGTFSARGTLRVTTTPAADATVTVDGYPADNWGMWTDLPAGTHQVCFEPAAGYANTPPCQTAVVTAGTETDITGSYS
jgi:hypothetical protein